MKKFYVLSRREVLCVTFYVLGQIEDRRQESGVTKKEKFYVLGFSGFRLSAISGRSSAGAHFLFNIIG